MSPRIARALAAVVLALAPLAGCGASGPGPAPHRVLALPPGEYVNAAWLTDGTIVTNLFPPINEVRPPTQVLFVDPRASGPAALRPVPLPPLPGCVVTDWVVDRAATGGRLTMRRMCYTGRPVLEPEVAVVVDVVHHPDVVTPLAPLPAVHPLTIAWRPDLHLAMISTSLAACTGLSALDPTGLVPAPAPVTIDGRSWRLDQPLSLNSGVLGPDCPGSGTAEAGTYADGGRTVLFYASAAAMDETGRAKRDAPTTLFGATAVDGGALFDPATVRPLVTGIGDPAGTAASADGRSVVFSGTLDPGGRGLWLIDRPTGETRLLAAGAFTAPSFGPGGREVLTVHEEESGEEESGEETSTLDIYCLDPVCPAPAPRTP